VKGIAAFLSAAAQWKFLILTSIEISILVQRITLCPSKPLFLQHFKLDHQIPATRANTFVSFLPKKTGADPTRLAGRQACAVSSRSGMSKIDVNQKSVLSNEWKSNVDLELQEYKRWGSLICRLELRN
jgi:hypothetical protein